MKIIVLLAIVFCFKTFAKSFECSSYGIIDIFVNGEFNEDFNVTVIDLYFLEKKETIQKVSFSKDDNTESFSFSANTNDWFIKIDTLNGDGVIEMDYRGILKQKEFVYCDIQQ